MKLLTYLEGGAPVTKGIKLITVLMVSVFALGLASCATTPKEQAAVEVQPSEEELERQRQDELERQRLDELNRMREQEMAMEETTAPPPSEEPTAFTGEVSVELGTVFFDFDKYDLRSDARDTLSANADWLKSNPGIQLQIEGHCDIRGTEEYNLALGERRANAVKSYLVSLGVDEARLFTISYGEEMLADSGLSSEAHAKNRRAQFKTATTQF